METTTTIRLFSHKSLLAAAVATGPLPIDVHMVAAAVPPFPPVYLCPNLLLYIVVIIIFNILFFYSSDVRVYTNTERGLNGRLGRVFSPLFAAIVLRSNRTRSRLFVRRVETTGIWYSVVWWLPRRQRVAFSPEFAHNNSHLTGGVLARKRNETYG